MAEVGRPQSVVGPRQNQTETETVRAADGGFDGTQQSHARRTCNLTERTSHTLESTRCLRSTARP